MKVRSKLVDVDFEFGRFEYKKDHLLVHSDPQQSIATTVYVSPEDVLIALRKLLASPRAIGYLLGFPFFLIRYRRRHRAKAQPPAQ